MSKVEKTQERTVRRYANWFVGLVILLAGITVLAVWMSRTRVPLLLTVATKVVPKGRYYAGPFAWLSNDEYVCFGADKRTLSLYRLGNGVSTPLALLLGARTGGTDIQPSPDGKWLLWSRRRDLTAKGQSSNRPEYYSGPVSFRAFITRLSDKHTQELKDFEAGEWDPDSRHVIDFNTKWGRLTTLVIRDALANRISRKVPFAPNVDLNLSDTMMIAPGRLVGISQPYVQEGLSDGTAPTFTEYGLDKTLHVVRTWSAIPPGRPIVKEVKISPTGDRIAWLVDSVSVDPAEARLRRLLPFPQAPGKPRQELWISRLDGTGMRVLGQTPSTVRHAVLLKVSDLRWLPDGKHLSFVYDTALWTVSANR